MKTWLILDCHYLAWRAYHAMKNVGLSVGDLPTDILYNFLRDVLYFQMCHQTKRLVFCFDYGKSRRIKIYPAYKENRKKPNRHGDRYDPKMIGQVKSQIDLLREGILPSVGFKNIFYQNGYEADDVIAKVCDELPNKERAIIIAADSDLYQLLRKNVLLWNPQTKRATTYDSFIQENGILPKAWTQVKAISGCSSDNIRGIYKVGNKLALKYLRGELKTTSKAYEDITKGKKIIERNLELVTLPFPGLKPIKLQNDEMDRDAWKKMARKYKMRSIEDGLA